MPQDGSSCPREAEGLGLDTGTGAVPRAGHGLCPPPSRPFSVRCAPPCSCDRDRSLRLGSGRSPRGHDHQLSARPCLVPCLLVQGPPGAVGREPSPVQEGPPRGVGGQCQAQTQPAPEG